MINELYKKTSLIEHLESLYLKYGFYMMKTRYFFSPPEKIDEIFKRIRIMNKGTYPEIIGNQFKIKSVRDMTTGFDSSKEDFKTILPVTPESQMITFTFEDDSTCTLRNSGTEPKGMVFFLIGSEILCGSQ
jgi:phosphomannomutase